MIRGSASVLLSLLVVACADDKEPAVCPASPSCADTFAPSQPLTDDSNAEALVGQLVTAMTDAGVPMNDQNLILGVLGPMCPQIVTVDPGLCP